MCFDGEGYAYYIYAYIYICLLCITMSTAYNGERCLYQVSFTHYICEKVPPSRIAEGVRAEEGEGGKSGLAT